MKSKSPLVSVIIPSKNRPNFLLTAIQSVMGQTYRNIEIIVVDDGSDVPLLPLLIEKFGHRVVCLRHDPSLGAPSSRNEGASYAKGKYIAFLDDDDSWFPDKLEKQVAALSHLEDDFGVVYCGYHFLVKGTIVERKNTYHDTGNLYEVALMGCPVGSPTALIRKEFFDKVGGFDINLPACQDWDLWIRLSRICRFYPVKQSLALYRVHGDQMSTDLHRKINARIMVVNKYHAEMSVYPKILSFQYQRIGSLCSLAGKKKEAKSYFFHSIRIYKANFGSWVHFVLQFGGKFLEKLLIERYGVTKVGKIRIFS